MCQRIFVRVICFGAAMKDFRLGRNVLACAGLVWARYCRPRFDGGRLGNLLAGALTQVAALKGGRRRLRG